LVVWRSLNCKLTGVFRKQARLSKVERACVHMVARLTKISNKLSRYFRNFMDDCFVNLGEEVYLLLTVQMWSFAHRVCVRACTCVCERERQGHITVESAVLTVACRTYNNVQYLKNNVFFEH
uniref:Uncharacterized protein n=1 Tax=Sinocyclocheilus grahami TaxID=75366 RepID=A0A672MXG3_SINGR